jgi:hypothetical protein
VEMIIEELTGL